MRKTLIFLLCIPVFAGNSGKIILPKVSGHSENRMSEINHLIGIMVEFQAETDEEPDALTSGSGVFLTASDTTGFSRCNGFIVDPPPHNHNYFEDQFRAINHYFNHVSGGNLNFSWDVIDQIYQLPQRMREYASEDTLLGRLFTEVVELASDEISQIYTSNSLIVIFHAGIGQDFSIPFLDPTPYDLKSAFVDDELLAGTDPPVINGQTVNSGIILPETQNHIFFNVIEEIFSGETDYCDYQLGLTGTFALMMGYALNLPPLYDTDTGDPGVGTFGLMDHGSNNGRGVIPAPPVAWTRILKGWDTATNIIADGPEEISTGNLSSQYHDIHKISISYNEYFLVENRNNWVTDVRSIERLRYEYPESDYRLGHWFDTVIEWMTDDQITVSEETGVITGFDHYDYGLPGSGLLIWHITEPPPNETMTGINNDREHRAVHLEEADGSVDIGFESYAVFESDDPTLGKMFDMWYAGNSGYAFANPNETNAPLLRFGMDTFPDTRSSSQGVTYIELSEISENGLTMTYTLTRYDPFPSVILSGDDIVIAGGGYNPADETGWLYFILHDSLFIRSGNSNNSSFLPGWTGKVLFNGACSPDTVMISDNQSDHYLFDENCQLQYTDRLSPMGFLETPDDLETTDTATAVGDIDNDGLDELLWIQDGDLVVKNANGTLVNGFPVSGNFTGGILISNLTGDNSPEMICRENNNIVIVSATGDRLFTMASRQPEQDLLIIPYWDEFEMALADGSKLWLFPIDVIHSYWLFPHGRPDNSAVVSGTHFQQQIPPIALDTQKAYNYPNPITEGVTSFRYYVGESNSVEIRIYDASGFLIEKLKNDHLSPGEYNETIWYPDHINPGLYLAEVRPDNGKSALVQVVYLK